MKTLIGRLTFFRDKPPPRRFESRRGNAAAVEPLRKSGGRPTSRIEMTARPGRIADRTEEETRNLSLMVSLLRRPSNAWQQRRRYVMSARHHQAAAPQVGPEHWMPAPEVSAPTRPTRPSPAAISASISPAASRTCPSAPDCATGCGTSRAATAAGVCAAEQTDSRGRRRAVSTHHHTTSP